MITFNNKLKDINNIDEKDVYILTDFDGTITKSNSDSSWSSIFKNPKVTKEFKDECISIYTYYHKYEIDDSLDINKKINIMNEWYQKNIQTLKDFNITKDIIDYAVNNTNIMDFRDGAKEFLETMYKKNIPVIVISAGVGNIIENFLIKNNCNYSNIHICSNFLEYKNNLITSIRDNNLIHPLNKDEVSLPISLQNIIKDKKNTILLGDNITDINMSTLNKNLFKIGFLDEQIEERIQTFKDNYDIVCTNNTSYNELKDIIDLFN